MVHGSGDGVFALDTAGVRHELLHILSEQHAVHGYVILVRRVAGYGRHRAVLCERAAIYPGHVRRDVDSLKLGAALKRPAVDELQGIRQGDGFQIFAGVEAVPVQRGHSLGDNEVGYNVVSGERVHSDGANLFALQLRRYLQLGGYDITAGDGDCSVVILGVGEHVLIADSDAVIVIHAAEQLSGFVGVYCVDVELVSARLISVQRHRQLESHGIVGNTVIKQAVAAEYLVVVCTDNGVPKDHIVNEEYSDIVLVYDDDVACLESEPFYRVATYSHPETQLLDDIAVVDVLQRVAERHFIRAVRGVPYPVVACHDRDSWDEVVCGQTLHGGFP